MSAGPGRGCDGPPPPYDTAPRLAGLAAVRSQARTFVGTARGQRQRPSRLFTDLFDLAPVAIGLFDDVDRLVQANDALCTLVRSRRPELLGCAAADLLHSHDPGGPLAGTTSDPSSHRVLADSDDDPVSCKVHSSTSVREGGTCVRLVSFQDVTARDRETHTWQYHATHDELTGLVNRRGLHERLDALLHEGTQVGVVFSDIDNFKRVNESLGHPAGDELLIAVAQRLQAEAPAGATVARFSGDEFVVVVGDVAACGGLDALAARMTASLRTVVPVRKRLGPVL